MTENTDYLTTDFIVNIKSLLKDEVDEIHKNDPTLLDMDEYDKWLKDQDYLIRYIRRKKGDVSATITFLVDVLKWRQRLGLSKLTDKSFPKEFFDFGGIHVYGTDKDGNSICHVRLCLFLKAQEILELLKKFVVYQMLKADEESANRSRQTGQDVGWVLLFDCTGAGVANADMDMTNFLNSTLKNFFPYGQKYVLNHNLPWLLNAIKSVIFAMLPSNVKRRIKFSNDKTISEFISEDQLPGYMGGKNPAPYPTVPAGVVTTSEMVKAGLLPMTDEEELRVEKYYEKVYSLVKGHQEKEGKSDGA